MSKTAAIVLWAATAYAYRVTVYDSEVQPLEEYTGGNSRFDSAGFVPPREGETLATMRKYARQTAAEMAEKWGVSPDYVSRDTDEEEALREAYKPHRERYA